MRGDTKAMPKGIVKEVKDDTVIVMLERQDMCGDCHACEMISGKKSCILQCQTKIKCEIGDVVEVQLSNHLFLKATYLLYGMPLIGFISGLCISYFLNLSDWITALVTLVSTSLSIIYIKIQDKRKLYYSFLPHITKKEPRM